VRTPTRVWGVCGFLVLLHFGLHLSLGLGEGAPDLLIVALLIAVRELDIGRAAGLGFFLGMLDDAFSVLAFGANTLALTLVGMGGARTRDLFVGDSLLFLTSYLVLGKWIRDFLHWVAVGEGLRESFVETMLIQSPISAAYAGLIGLVVIAISGLGWETVR
jgi:cell shape-determining protein MreD